MIAHDAACQCVWCRDHDDREEPIERDPVEERRAELEALAYEREHTAARLG